MKSIFLKTTSLILAIMFSISMCAFADEYDTMPIDDTIQSSGPFVPLFSDIAPDDWAYSAITSLYEKGIISGDGTGAINPNGGVTKEEVAKMLVAARSYDLSEDAVLDIPDAQTVSDWAKVYVAKAIEKGILTGDENGAIKGNSVVTRAEMATLIVRSLNASIDNFETSSFSDISENSWYGKYVECAKTLGIVTGYTDGTFGGEKEVTRKEAFAMINRLVRLLEALEA